MLHKGHMTRVLTDVNGLVPLCNMLPTYLAEELLSAHLHIKPYALTLSAISTASDGPTTNA